MILKKTNDWRKPALHFMEHGVYTHLTPNPAPNSAYMQFWNEEAKRCVEGVTINGYFIPGYYYFYLNYSPIIKVTYDPKDYEKLRRGEKVKGERVTGFPDVWDRDYEYFVYLDEAERRGEHASVLKTRGRGYSLKGASMLNRNYHLIRKSRSVVIGAESEYLTGSDSILTKTWDIMDFISEHTPWGKLRQVKNTDDYRKASYIENGIEKGYQSSIAAVTLGNNPQRARGKRAKLILWEEAGANRYLKQAWEIARPSVEQGGVTFGLMVAFGTGGTNHADYEGLEELFYNAEAYNIYAIPNTFDENASGKLCGFFHGEQHTREGFIDKDGNSDIKAALEIIKTEREKDLEKGKDPNSLLQSVAEKPICPAEATLRLGGTIFPTQLINKRLVQLTDFELNKHNVGKLDFEAGELRWIDVQGARPHREHPVKKLEEGCIEIFETPRDLDDPTNYRRYIAGIDPYRQDVATTNSLGSILIYDRLTKRVVAEYTGRPESTRLFYENCRKLLLYYRATAMYENNVTGLYHYFEEKKCLHLLEDTPYNLRDRNVWREGTNTSKGITTSSTIISKGLEFIKNWLLETHKEGDKEFYNLEKIRSVGLLKELANYQKDGNFDRISALIMTMWYDTMLAEYDETVELIKKQDASKYGAAFDKFISNKNQKKEMLFNKLMYNTNV